MAHIYITMAPDTDSDVIGVECSRYRLTGRYTITFRGAPGDTLTEAVVTVNSLDDLAAIGKQITDYCESQVVSE